VFEHPSLKITGNPNVEDSIVVVGKNVNEILVQAFTLPILNGEIPDQVRDDKTAFQKPILDENDLHFDL
jgi:hypothetical protein